MTDLETQLATRWTHSFEEDHDGVLVYRPATFDFPPARGREGIEFRPDGSFVEWAIGRGDAAEPRPGTWQRDATGRVCVDGDRGPRTLDIVQLTPERLEVRIEDGSS